MKLAPAEPAPLNELAESPFDSQTREACLAAIYKRLTSAAPNDCDA